MNNKTALHSYCKDNQGSYLDICCKIYDDDISASSKSTKNTKITDFLSLRGNVEFPIISDNCFILKQNKQNSKYYLNNTTIFIEKYLDEGAYGVVFVAKDMVNNKRYIIKLTPLYPNELVIMQDISRITIESGVPHFVLLYKQQLCNKIVSISSNISSSHFEEYIDKVNNVLSTTNDKYSMYIMELFDGNCLTLLSILDCKIKSAITVKTKLEYIKIASSIYAQIYMSILMIHKCTGYLHNDAHLGNFFYKKITHKSNEYFHYKFMDQDIYIKNMGYLIVIGDYGWATAINPYNINYNDIFWDYISINENIESFSHIHIDSVIKQEFEFISPAKKNNLLIVDIKYDENYFFDILRKNYEYMFYTLDDILKSSKSYKIINDIPFIIPIDYVIGNLDYIIKQKYEPQKSCIIS